MAERYSRDTVVVTTAEIMELATNKALDPTVEYWVDRNRFAYAPDRETIKYLVSGDGNSGGANVVPPPRAEILIYSATPSGILAAVGSLKAGGSPIIIEPDYHIGGMVTSSLRTDWRGYSYSMVSSGTAEYYKLVAAAYGIDAQEAMHHDQFSLPNAPYVAAFNKVLSDRGIRVYSGWRLVESSAAVLKGSAAEIRKLTFENTENSALTCSVEAFQFLDAGYEGDLSARAGVISTTGRESSTKYGESYAGVTTAGVTFTGVSPYVVQGSSASGLLPGIENTTLDAPGTGDSRVMAFCNRFNVTNDPAKMIAFTDPRAQPDNYDPLRYEFMMRWLEQPGQSALTLFDVVGHYTMRTETVGAGYLLEGWNAKLPGMSINAIGLQHSYATSTYAQRKVLQQQHRDHTLGFIFALRTDSRVPVAIRNALATWGLLADDTYVNKLPPQLYIREARRMVGSQVLTQLHCQGDAVMPDPVAWGIYTIDSHTVSLRGGTGTVVAEGTLGNISVPRRYAIGRGVVLPKASECSNLQVLGTPSVSHIGWTTYRIEPTMMSVAEAAGVAAALAIRRGVPIHSISGADVAPYTGFKTFKSSVMPVQGTVNITDGSTQTLEGKGTIEFTGTWKASSFGFGYEGLGTFDDDAGGKNSKQVRWKPTLGAAGQYRFRFHTPPVISNAPAVVVWVRSNLGYTKLVLDERFGDIMWYDLGVFPFAADGSEFVILDNAGSAGYVRANAIDWERVGDAVISATIQGLGADMVTNGGFATDTSWTKSGGWAISGGVATATSVASGVSMIQNVGLVQGKTYEITMDVVTLSSGSLRVTTSGGAAGKLLTAPGTYKFVLTPTGTSGNLSIAPVSAFSGSIDNVACREILT